MDGFDINVWIEIINTTGFPIAVCGALFWIVNSVLKSVRDTLQALDSTIQNNTAAINEMLRHSKGDDQ